MALSEEFTSDLVCRSGKPGTLKIEANTPITVHLITPNAFDIEVNGARIKWNIFEPPPEKSMQDMGEFLKSFGGLT